MGRVTASSEGESSPLLTTTYAYTSLGHIERQTDAMGRVQKFLHDALGRMVDHVRVGDGSDFIRNTAEFVDSGMSNSRTSVSQFDGNGAVTRTQFDFAGRRFLVHYPGSDLSATPTMSPTTPTTVTAVANTELFLYDDLSQVVKRLDGDGGVTLMAYDASGRLIQRGLEAVRDAIAVYNAGDFLHRDAFGRIVHAQSFAGLNGGSPNGTPVIPGSLMDAKTTYDSLSRAHEESWSVYVNPAQVMKTKSTFGTADRVRSTMRYENGLSTQDLEVGFGDDAINRMSSVNWTRPGVGTGALTLAGYSWLGSMRQQRTNTYGGATTQATGVSVYTYDQYGRMTQMRDDVTPATPPVSLAVTLNQFDYVYNDAHNLVKEEYTKVSGKAGDRFTYDAYHRLKDAYMGVNSTVMAGGDPTSFNASTMTKAFNYELDAAQNRTNVNESTAAGTEVTPYYLVGDGSNRYQYVGNARPEYDNRGNLTFDGRFYYRYDFLNRLQEVWKVIKEGATAQQSAIEGGEKYMVVDSVEALDSSRKDVEEDVFQLMRRMPTEIGNPTFRSRLRSPIPGGVIVVPNAASGTSSSTSGGGMPGFILPADLELVAVYGYDAYNRRVIRVVNDPYVGGAWVSTYDGWREAVQHTLDLTSGVQLLPVKQFVYGSGLDEMIAYRRLNGTSWEDYYLLSGGQDTAAKLVNQSGQVVEQYEYDPFGKATVYTSAGALVDVGPAGTSPEDGTWSAYGLPHLYKAMRLDPETGNCYVRNRFYDPRTGRFMSRDPIGVWGDAGNMGNEYAYAWNRPLVVGDPLGLQGQGPLTPVGGGTSDPNAPLNEIPGGSPKPGSGGSGGTFVPGTASRNQNCFGASCGKNAWLNWALLTLLWAPGIVATIESPLHAAQSRDRSRGNPTFGFPLPRGTPFLFPFSPRTLSVADRRPRSASSPDQLVRQLGVDARATQLDHGAHRVGGVEAVRLPCREPRLVVEPLGSAGGVAGFEVGKHAVEAATQSACDFAKRSKARAARPGDPLVEPTPGPRRRVETAVDVDQRLLEQVGAVQHAVLLRQVDEPLVLGRRHVPWVAQQSPSQVLDAARLVRTSKPLPFAASHLVDGLGCELLHMEAVEDDRRVGKPPSDRLHVALEHVDRRVANLGACFRTDLDEERFQGRCRPTLLGPQDAAGLEVGDECQVVVSLPERQLVDGDGGDLRPIDRRAVPCHHALDDVANRSPGDAHQGADRGLVAALGQPRDLLFEVHGEPRLRIGPAHLLDDYAAVAAVDARQRRLEEHCPGAEVEVAPSTGLQPVVAGALPAASGASGAASPTHFDDKGGRADIVGLELHLADREARERKQPTCYCLGAHRNFSGGWLSTTPASRSRCAFSPLPSISASADWLPGRATPRRRPQERQERPKLAGPWSQFSRRPKMG
jgi:RHS repeat-associated protein